MKPVLLTLLFCAFLYPLSVGEYSVNYAFVLYPPAIILSRLRFARPPAFATAAMILYTAIFALSVIYFGNVIELTPRRFASFVIFMSVFSYTVIRVDDVLVAAFKRAVVVMSVFFSMTTIAKLIGLEAVGPVHFEVKEIIGSQRLGFIYVLGFWIAVLEQRQRLRPRIANYAAAGVILAGLFLTFSRSSIVALGATLALFAAVRIAKAIPRPSWRGAARTAVVVAVAFAAWSLINYLLPLTIEYYATTLVRPLLDKSLFGAATIETSSEGIRVARIREIAEFVLAHPMTGNGYLGFWAISPTGGSAHNQFFDALLRVGVVGFAFYLYLLLKVLRFLAKHDAALLWGCVGVLIYGLFHETFKESQGGFVLAVLIGMLAEYVRSGHTYLQPWRSPRPAQAVSAAHVQQSLPG